MAKIPKLERVLTGLRICMKGLTTCPKECPYYGQCEGQNKKPLMGEIYARLKAYEPRVMTLEEVRALQDSATVWLEDNDKVDIIPAIVNHIWNSLPNMASFTTAYMREVKADMLWYGVKWRCWTARPTVELMEMVKWE